MKPPPTSAARAAPGIHSIVQTKVLCQVVVLSTQPHHTTGSPHGRRPHLQCLCCFVWRCLPLLLLCCGLSLLCCGSWTCGQSKHPSGVVAPLSILLRPLHSVLDRPVSLLCPSNSWECLRLVLLLLVGGLGESVAEIESSRRLSKVKRCTMEWCTWPHGSMSVACFNYRLRFAPALRFLRSLEISPEFRENC